MLDLPDLADASRSCFVISAMALSAACSGRNTSSIAPGDEVRPVEHDAPSFGLDAGATPDPREGTFESAPCPFQPPRASDVSCGYLTVAENRRGSLPAERGLLSLAVAIFKSQAASVAPPIVYLAGGPGADAIAEVVASFTYFQPLTARYDLVVLD